MSSPRMRWFLLALAALSGVAALVPDISLAPLEVYLERSRTPERTLRAARTLLAAGGLALACVALVWPRVRRVVTAVALGIAGLPRRRYWLLVLALAGILRLAVAFAFSYQPTADARWYHETAASLARGEGFAVLGVPTAYRFPGYPFLLSLTYRLFGPHAGLAWIWGTLATIALLAAVYRVADRLYGRPVARLATAALAAYPALALGTGLVMSDLPFTAGLLVLVACLLGRRSDRPAAALLLGLGLGALVLTRGVALGMVAIVPAIWRLRGVPVRRVAASSLLLTLAMASCLAPWLLRNQRLFGRPLLSTNLGANLYIGNHAGASGGFNFHRPDVPTTALFWNEAHWDEHSFVAASDFIRRQPIELLRLLPNKLLHLYLLETGTVTSLFQGTGSQPAAIKYGLYGLTQGAYLILLLVFAYRLPDLFRSGFRPRGPQWTGWLVIACFTAIALVFFGQDRFRLPILPWMAIEAVVAGLRGSGLAHRGSPAAGGLES